MFLEIDCFPIVIEHENICIAGLNLGAGYATSLDGIFYTRPLIPEILLKLSQNMKCLYQI